MEVVLNVLGSLATAAVTALCGYLVAWLRKRISAEQMQKYAAAAQAIKQQVDTKRGWAYHAVMAVEDAYKDIGGPEKLQKAIGMVCKRAEENHIPVTDEELEYLCRGAYQIISKGFGDAWKKEIVTMPTEQDDIAPEPIVK